MVKIGIAAAVLLILLGRPAFIITEAQQGIILQFGKPERIIREPGIYLKYPFIQELIVLDKRILAAEARPAEYITLDKKRLTVDTVSRWKIADPLQYYQTVKDYRGAISRLEDTIFARLRESVANHTFIAFIREERENIMARVTKETAEVAKQYGIEVVDVRIKRVDLPEEVHNSVFARMRAEREREANRYRAEGAENGREIRAKANKDREIILAEAYRQAEVLRGDGDAEATAVYADAYGKDQEFFSFLRHLDVYEKILGQDTTVLLRPDSPLMEYLDSPAAPMKGRTNVGQ
jgi:membrane protease subunit HflC